MNKDLLEIHNNVKDWLKFAEAKNAMIIAFNGASIFGISKMPILDYGNSFGFWEWYFLFSIVFLVFSTLTALISFIPSGSSFVHQYSSLLNV